MKILTLNNEVLVHQFETLGDEQITDLSSAVSLSPPAGTARATIAVTGADVRYKSTGDTPTDLLGVPIRDGSFITWDAGFDDLELIEVSPSAQLDIEYYG